MPESRSAVRVAGLTHSYGDRVALSDVHLDVPAGSVHCLVGPNGAGKTTLLRILLGLLGVQAGEVELAGERRGPGGAASLRAVAGFVEAPRFWPALSGTQTLETLRALDGLPDPPDIGDTLALVGLTAAAGRPVAGYSLGMRQRLAIAAALLRRPEVLLLDEPTSGLDPVGAAEVQDLLARLAAEGAAVLLSSHDLLEVSRVGTDVTVLREGQVTYSGPVDALDARAPAPSYLLRTGDDARAAPILAARAGAVAVRSDGVSGRLAVADVDALVAELSAAGVPLRELRVETEPMDALFRALTSAAAVPVPSPAVNPDRSAPSPEVAATVATARPGRVTRRGVRVVAGRELARAARAPGVPWLLAACVFAPFLFVAVLDLQDALPRDTLFGRQLHASGFAVPLVVLGFAGSWLCPVFAGLAAGDVFSVEDHHGTWPLLLTRSRSRGELYAGKLAAALVGAVVPVLLLAVASLAAGALVVGTQPLVDAGGRDVGGAGAVGLVLLGWLSTLPAVLALTAVGAALSVRSGRSWVGVGGPVVLGLLLVLLGQLNAPPVAHRLLLSTALVAWHGLATSPGSATPVLVGLATAAGWGAVAAAAGWRVLVGGTARAGRAGLAVTATGAALAAVAVVVAATVPGGRVSAAALQASLAGSVNGREVLQARAAGLTGIAGGPIHAAATCERPGRGPASAGAAEDWACITRWTTPGGAAVVARYDIAVRTDGCYVATGPAGVVGPATLPSGAGTVTNPLYEFDGCLVLS